MLGSKKKRKTGAKTAAKKGKGEAAAAAGDEAEDEGGEAEEMTTEATTPAAAAESSTVKPVVTGEAETSPISKQIADPTAVPDPMATEGKNVPAKSSESRGEQRNNGRRARTE